MIFDVSGIDGVVVFGGFYVVGCYGLIVDKEECVCGDFVIKIGYEDGGGFYVDVYGVDFLEIGFECVVVFLDVVVGGVDGVGLVVVGEVVDGGGDGFLKCEGGEGWDFGWEIIVVCIFVVDGGDGEDEIVEFGVVFDVVVFVEEEYGFWGNCVE